MGKIQTGPGYTEPSELFLRDQQQRQAAWVRPGLTAQIVTDGGSVQRKP